MKKVLQYIVLIILFSFLGIVLTNKNQFRPVFRQWGQKLHFIAKPCTQPIKYAIGDVDPRFNLSQSDFLAIIKEAQKIWEDPISRQLFQYDPNATFKINLVYDDRQQKTQESQKMEENLDTLKDSHETVIKQYNSLSSSYKQRLDNYNKAVADYEKKLNKYNEEVDSWNVKGGAPSDVYSDLKDDKKDLQETHDKLEKERQAINKLIGQSNNLAQKEQTIVSNYNSNLNTYKDKYGGESQFDKGVYDGTKIDIFQFNQHDDLRLTIAHELGHALGIDHLNDQQSVMYYLMGDQDMTSPKLSTEDISALKSVCEIQ